VRYSTVEVKRIKFFQGIACKSENISSRDENRFSNLTKDITDWPAERLLTLSGPFIDVYISLFDFIFILFSVLWYVDFVVLTKLMHEPNWLAPYTRKPLKEVTFLCAQVHTLILLTKNVLP
jgi:hypothetical protein